MKPRDIDLPLSAWRHQTDTVYSVVTGCQYHSSKCRKLWRNTAKDTIQWFYSITMFMLKKSSLVSIIVTRPGWSVLPVLWWRKKLYGFADRLRRIIKNSHQREFWSTLYDNIQQNFACYLSVLLNYPIPLNFTANLHNIDCGNSHILRHITY